jgi:hypothetical protein
VKDWIFDDLFHKKGASIGVFGARDNPTIRAGKFFDKIGLFPNLFKLFFH